MNTISLAPLWPIINESLTIFLSTLAAGLAGYVAVWLQKHLTFLSQQTDAVITNGFNRGLQNGISIAMNKIDTYEGDHSTVAVKSWIASKAGQYAIDHAPDYVSRFTNGLTPQQIASDAALKALAYLPPIQIQTDADTSKIKVVPVAVTSLPSVKS